MAELVVFFLRYIPVDRFSSLLIGHMNDSSIHFTESAINHNVMQQVGITTHDNIDSFINSVGLPSGLSTLNSSSKVPNSQLPGGIVNQVFVVANIAARDALIPNEGDVAKVLDAGGGLTKSYLWDGSQWQEAKLDPDPIISSRWAPRSANTVSVQSLSGTDILQFIRNSPTDYRMMNGLVSGLSVQSANVLLNSCAITASTSTITVPKLFLNNTTSTNTVTGDIAYGQAPRYIVSSTVYGTPVSIDPTIFIDTIPFTPPIMNLVSVSQLLAGTIGVNGNITLPDYSGLSSLNPYLSIIYIRNLTTGTITITPGISGSIDKTTIQTGLTCKYYLHIGATDYTLIFANEYTDTGIITVNPTTSTPNSNAGSISGSNALTLSHANATNPGVMSILDQTIGGVKTFVSLCTSDDNIKISNLTIESSPSSGTYSITLPNPGTSGQILSYGGFVTPSQGIQTMGAVSVVPNINGAVISSNILTFSVAAQGFPGVISASNQIIGPGIKTFLNPVTVNTQIILNNNVTLAAPGGVAYSLTFPLNLSGEVLSTDGAGVLTWTNRGAIFLADTIGLSPTTNGVTLSSNILTFQPADASNFGMITGLSQIFSGVKTFSAAKTNLISGCKIINAALNHITLTSDASSTVSFSMPIVASGVSSQVASFSNAGNITFVNQPQSIPNTIEVSSGGVIVPSFSTSILNPAGSYSHANTITSGQIKILLNNTSTSSTITFTPGFSLILGSNSSNNGYSSGIDLVFNSNSIWQPALIKSTSNISYFPQVTTATNLTQITGEAAYVALSSDGIVAVNSAPTNSTNNGAVVVYRNNVFEQTLIAAGVALQQGLKVVISPDGRVIVISGIDFVWVWKISAGVWSLFSTISVTGLKSQSTSISADSPDGTASIITYADGTNLYVAQLDGTNIQTTAIASITSCDISSDKNYITVGSLSGNVAVYFQSSPSSWTLQTNLTASGNANSSINHDGSVLAISGTNQIKIYRRTGVSWSNESNLVPSDLSANTIGDNFNVSKYGATVSIGSTNSMRGWIFTKNTSTSWTQQGLLITIPGTGSSTIPILDGYGTHVLFSSTSGGWVY